MTNALLIDLSSLAHPIYHMAASEPDPNATSTKVVERVRALANGQPHVAICCDAGKSFRADIDRNYKAQRPEKDAPLLHQIALAIEVLKGDGFPIWMLKGFEADDVIATATEQIMRLPNRAVTIATADKDLLQLVSEDGAITVHSLRDGSTVDWDAVYLKFGVYPNQIRDYLALVGDASDNIVGAKGIGPKKAAELLTKYGSLTNVFINLTQHGTHFTPAIASSLREFEKRLPVVRNLLTLRTDVPIYVDAIWEPRVPVDADLAVFGEEEPVASAPSSYADIIAADIEEAMPSAHQTPPVAMPVIEPPTSGPVPPDLVPPSANNGGKTEHAVTLLPTPQDFDRQLEPRNYQEAKLAATDMFAARLFSQWGNPAAVLAIIMSGREFGIPMMASLRAFDNIDGKPAMKADLIRALVLKSGKVEYFDVISRSDKESTWAIKRNGRPEVRLTYTIEEGKAAWSKDQRAWLASGWGRNPADMLVARASSKLARLVCPDVTHGLYCGEEFES